MTVAGLCIGLVESTGTFRFTSIWIGFERAGGAALSLRFHPKRLGDFCDSEEEEEEKEGMDVVFAAVSGKVGGGDAVLELIMSWRLFMNRVPMDSFR